VQERGRVSTQWPQTAGAAPPSPPRRATLKTTDLIEPEAAPATLAEPLHRYAVLIQHSVDWTNLVGPFARESDALERLRNRTIILEDAKCKIFAMVSP
jgi:hypothetical protein